MLGVIASSYRDDYAALVQADDPLGYWRHGEPSGTVMLDSSGHGRHGTYGGTFSLGNPGAISGDPNTCLHTSDSSGRGTVTSAAWMDGLTAFSLETWVKFDFGHDGTNGDAMLSRYGSGGFQYLLFRTTANRFGVQAFINGSPVNCNGTTAPTVGEWYHVLGKWSGTQLKIQVNGEVENAVAANGTLGTSAINFEVGRYSGNSGTVPGAYFDESVLFGSSISDAAGLARYEMGVAA